jgi:hypothetical protein
VAAAGQGVAALWVTASPLIRMGDLPVGQQPAVDVVPG